MQSSETHCPALQPTLQMLETLHLYFLILEKYIPHVVILKRGEKKGILLSLLRTIPDDYPYIIITYTLHADCLQVSIM